MSDAPTSPSDEVPPWPTPNASHVQAAVRRLVDAFDPLRIIVFGLYVRDEMHSISDLDLLVILPEVEHKRDAAVAMRRVLSNLPVSKDIVVATPEEIEARRESTWHIIARALDDGITVYSKEQDRERVRPGDNRPRSADGRPPSYRKQMLASETTHFPTYSPAPRRQTDAGTLRRRGA